MAGGLEWSENQTQGKWDAAGGLLWVHKPPCALEDMGEEAFLP